ncbi:site-specific integrase [Bifidobacterium panos]|uniref:site-specific integrase n=1 Tax=Bifidobacterium panos TaxID=2675321 RepID=UPI001554B2D4
MEVTPGTWRARCRFRFPDGKFKQVERYRDSKMKAEAALKNALVDLQSDTGGTIRSQTSLSCLADLFMADKRERRSAGTVQTYQVAVDAHIKPDIGDLAVIEATPERLNKYLLSIAKEDGHGAAKNCRSVLSGMMALAVRNGALLHNPVAEVERIEKPGKPGSEPIPPERYQEFLNAVRNDEVLRERDSAELFEFMAATGFRIGEACGLRWSAVDFDHGRVTMSAIAKRITSKGMILQEYGKTDKSARTIDVPDVTMRMLSERRERMSHYGYILVFPTLLGKIRDPNNSERDLRERRDALGFPGITSHSLRKSVATILDAKGLSARAIADYLGHAKPSMTEDVYMGRNLGSEEAAVRMNEALDDPLSTNVRG